MIKRIFTVTINPDMRAEFERDFQVISVAEVKKAPGVLDVEIGFPVEGEPDKYAMISSWASVDDLVGFAGENWSEPVIPDGMQHYVVSSSVEHFQFN